MQRKISEIYETIHNSPARSAREKGIIQYADELLEAYLSNRGLSLKDFQVRIGKITEADLLRAVRSAWPWWATRTSADGSAPKPCSRSGWAGWYSLPSAETGLTFRLPRWPRPRRLSSTL